MRFSFILSKISENVHKPTNSLTHKNTCIQNYKRVYPLNYLCTNPQNCLTT